MVELIDDGGGDESCWLWMWLKASSPYEDKGEWFTG
jgi:hypothetical protein